MSDKKSTTKTTTKCPKCGKSFKSLGTHDRMAHGPGGPISPSGGSSSTDGNFGGQIGRGIQASQDPRRGQLDSKFIGTKHAPNLPSTMGVFDEDGKPIWVMRKSGLRVQRKVGDRRHYDQVTR